MSVAYLGSLGESSWHGIAGKQPIFENDIKLFYINGTHANRWQANPANSGSCLPAREYIKAPFRKEICIILGLLNNGQRCNCRGHRGCWSNHPRSLEYVKAQGLCSFTKGIYFPSLCLCLFLRILIVYSRQANSTMSSQLTIAISTTWSRPWKQTKSIPWSLHSLSREIPWQ